MNAETRLAELLETVWVPTNKAITLSEIRGALTVEAYALVRLTLEAAMVPADDSIEAKLIAAEMTDAIGAMRTVGLSLSSPDRQAVVDLLAFRGQWPDAMRDAVKALGGTHKPRWQVEGYATEPTLEDVQAKIDEARLINAKALFNERMTVGGNAGEVWSQAWTDAEAV